MIFDQLLSLMSAYVVIILKHTPCFTKKMLFLVTFIYENAVLKMKCMSMH